MRKVLLLALPVLAVAACGGDGGMVGDDDDDDGNNGGADAAPDGPNDVDPTLIPGGGIADAPIGGEINVYVIDQRTGAPVAGAEVVLGGGQKATTDATGLAVIADAALEGAQTVTAAAAGHVPTTWAGVGGANVTLPLAASGPPPTATVTGTIAGWNNVPGVNLGDSSKYTLAVILPSFSGDLNAPENNLTQPTGQNNTPKNLCTKTGAPGGGGCNFTMLSRTGEVTPYAVVVRGFTNGKPDDVTKHTYEILGWAIGSKMNLAPGQTMSNVSLQYMPAMSPQTVNVDFGSLPGGGLDEIVGLPVIDAGANGKFVLPLPLVKPGATEISLPPSNSPIAGTLDVIGVANPAGMAAFPFSTVAARKVSGATATLPAWPAPPAAPTSGGGTITVSPVAGAALHFVSIVDGSNVAKWNFTLFGSTTSVTLPTLASNPLSGSLTVQVTGTLGTGSGTSYKVTDFTATSTAASGVSSPYTP